MKPTISVIIPVYNVEAYLSKCIDSVRNQTYRNLEILLVNDGSTDYCESICERYAALDARIKVIHKENGGLSDARNAGIEAARGEFLGFVDSDDWIDEDMYELLYNLISEYEADIAICRIREVSGKEIIDGSTNDLVVCNGAEALMFMATQKNDYRFNHTVTNKLIRKELIQDARFPVGTLVEDIYFTPPLMYASKRCVYRDEAKYNYLTDRHDSIMNAEVTDKMICDELNGYQELELFLSSKGIHDGIDHIRTAFLGRLLNFHYEVKNSSLQNKEELLAALEELFQLKLNKSIKTKMRAKKKVQMSLFELSPRLYDGVHGAVKRAKTFKKKMKPKKVLNQRALRKNGVQEGEVWEKP